MSLARHILIGMNRNIYMNNRRYCNIINTTINGNSDASIKTDNWKNDFMDFYSKLKSEGRQQLNEKYLLKENTKPLGTELTEKFLDYCIVKTTGGNGGHGRAEFLHIKYNEFAGPSGGDGGNGGHVLFLADNTMSDLSEIKRNLKAKNGESGGIKSKQGAGAPNTIIRVPVGTIITRDGEEICQLKRIGEIFIAARGGAGGKGNEHFVSSIDTTPQVSERGGFGEEFTYELQMEVIANIGLIGCPNAGKSTLIRTISRARPKVAAYPFTTLAPHIGVVEYRDFYNLRVADIPGLVEGSHKDEGLGIDFLKHIKKCNCLLYVLDMSQDRPSDQFEMLKYELEQFSSGLSQTPHALIANKMDLPNAKENFHIFQECYENLPLIPISAKYKKNIDSLASIIRFISEIKTPNIESYFVEK